MSPFYNSDGYTFGDGGFAFGFGLPEDSGGAIRHELSYLAYTVSKRCFDVGITLAAIVIAMPVLLVVAALIKLHDFGPVLFVQTRVGKGGKHFKCFKFRSMVCDAEKLKPALLAENKHDDHRTFKLENDPRVTWIGRLIRKTSIDELPQLFNVLLGDMSVVGPRPPVPSEVALYNAWDRRRLEVKPGLTCIWQVSGRGDIPFHEQVRLDIEYIDSQNLLLDFKLMAKTIPAVLSTRGAY